MFPVFCKTGGNLSPQKETLTEQVSLKTTGFPLLWFMIRPPETDNLQLKQSNAYLTKPCLN